MDKPWWQFIIFAMNISDFDPVSILRKIRRQLDRLWVRIAFISVMSLVAILVARITDPYLPEGLMGVLGADAVNRLLEIIANSMLAVTTFSLTVMVSVFRSASTQWTPRVHRLMLDDKVTQNTLAAFVGAYIYALSSIILLEAKVFKADQVVVLFFFTIGILAIIIVSIVRWIVHLQTLGSLIETTRRIEEATLKAFEFRMNKPCLGGRPLLDVENLPAGLEPVRSETTGYLQHIYEGALSEMAEEAEIEIFLTAPVGRFIYEGEPICHVTRLDDDIRQKLRENIFVSDLRNFDEDPRFGLIVLGEIGSKALSPGINDPGTAIDVIGRMARILIGWRVEGIEDGDDVMYPRLHVPPLRAADLIEDGFDPIARDAGGMIEVQIALQKALIQLCRHTDEPLASAARGAAKRAYRRAAGQLTFEPDLERLRRITPDAIKDNAD